MKRSHPPEPELPDEGPSKGQRKRDAHAAQDLGEQLIGLPDADLKALDLHERLYDAIVEARRITSHGGGLRQRQYIGKLMRGVDLEPIRELLTARATNTTRDIQRFHRVEAWRARLIEQGGAALTDLKRSLPDLDTTELEHKVAAAQAEKARGATGNASRDLFRTLRELLG